MAATGGGVEGAFWHLMDKRLGTLFNILQCNKTAASPKHYQMRNVNSDKAENPEYRADSRVRVLGQKAACGVWGTNGKPAWWRKPGWGERQVGVGEGAPFGAR